MSDNDSISNLVRDLDRSAPHHLDRVLAERLAEVAGAASVDLLLADYGDKTLVAVARPTEVEDLVSADSPAGLAYRTQEMIEDEAAVYLPVSVRSERIGVLVVRWPDERRATRTDLRAVAGVLGHVLAAARRYTDRFERIRRRENMDLAAEIQWNLLPVLAYDCPEYSIAGALEPAYEVGGDTFDYAVGAEGLTVSVTDAMGHGLRASLMASLAVSAMRNVRRGGGGPAEQMAAAAHGLTEQFDAPGFVAGLVLEIDVDDGAARVVNAGHLPPLLLRDGEISEVPLHPDTPMGLFPDTTYAVQSLDLRPGDRLLIYTDGVADTTVGPDGGCFGEEGVRAWLRDSAEQSPVEVCVRLTCHVVDNSPGPLPDDATVVCVDWRGRTEDAVTS